jgi:hypothetical protein
MSLLARFMDPPWHRTGICLLKESRRTDDVPVFTKSTCSFDHGSLGAPSSRRGFTIYGSPGFAAMKATVLQQRPGPSQVLAVSFSSLTDHQATISTTPRQAAPRSPLGISASRNVRGDSTTLDGRNSHRGQSRMPPPTEQRPSTVSALATRKHPARTARRFRHLLIERSIVEHATKKLSSSLPHRRLRSVQHQTWTIERSS